MRLACAAEELKKTYGSGDTAVPALRGVSAGFERGTFTAVMGPSGSGKSTLMHCLAGLDRVDSGQVLLGGVVISGLADRALTKVRRDRVGFVFQSFNLVPTLTALQNILLPLDLAGRRPDRDRLDLVVQALRIGDRLEHRPSELSGGQQQRVAVARALITEPDVLFADEPTGALDSTTATTLLSFLRRSCRELGQTIVMVTHDPMAASFADRALLLSDGLIVQEIHQPTPDLVLNAMRGLAA
ncbi:putative ABC transport system ATP-binding protein [Kibdelosporangium banguiense]|uniref:ABC transport system ATP-binding protein n=1 Tax=Kibdelosporangium banguiense TaxID=1365924 RepID=A0ABS4T6G7_9PSEU|nr:ABC transporter ATP-binding protein [Kibdelosporangium banguiense]MBP2319978.1 putative ABC transport system ATP-binding protein [Kibdelosporangium banguiense]